MLKAVEFEILRAVRSGGSFKIELARKPLRVATLIDEKTFSKDHLLNHAKTVFLEDRVHDWDWSDGKFSYYTRLIEPGARADVLAIYKTESV